MNRAAFLRLTLVAAALVPLAACATSGQAPNAVAAVSAKPKAGQEEGRTAYGYYLAGEAAIGGGSSTDAARYFALASDLQPQSIPLRNRAFTSAIVAGDIHAAARLSPPPGDGTAPVQGLGRMVRAVDALAEGRGKAAWAELQNPSVGGPHETAAALLKPWTAQAAGDVEGACALPRPDPNPVLASVGALGQAELLERNGRHPEAEAIFRKRANGKNSLFTIAYGAFLERRGRSADALALYKQVLERDPRDGAILRARARVEARRPAPPMISVSEGAAEALIAPAALMLAQHEGDSGLAYLRLSLRLDPTVDEAWVLVGDAMSGAGDKRAARIAWEHVRSGSNQYVTARSRLAIALQEEGDKPAAIKLAKETLDGTPDDPRLMVVYAELLRDSERYEEAVQVLTRLIDRASDHGTNEKGAGWQLYYLRGASNERLGAWKDAEPDLQRALKLKPDSAEVLNYLGFAWVDRGEHLNEAMPMLQKAVSLSPESGAIIDSLGWAHYRLGQYPLAVKALEKAVLLDPADPEVNDHLGDAYWRVGRKVEAEYQWKRVLTLAADAKLRGTVGVKLKAGLDASMTSELAPPAPAIRKP